MTAVADDMTAAVGALPGTQHRATGVGLVLFSAVCFGVSGTLVHGLLDTGWSPGAATLVRVTLAALLLAGPGVVALRGRWSLLRRNAGVVLLFGVLAVAGSQLCYFSAVQHMEVGTALLIEYTSPAAVVGWLWLRRGQRPGRLTLVGTGLAALGLVCVLDVLGGVGVSPVGVAWALAGMVGVATYFVIAADDRTGLPPITLAAAGLAVGAVSLGILAAARVLPVAFSTSPAEYSGHQVPFWVPALALGLVSGALAYGAGIAGARHLGPRLGAFVALAEVLAAIVAAWLVLGEAPRPVQLAGGALVVLGVVVVRLGEPAPAVSVPAVSVPAAPTPAGPAPAAPESDAPTPGPLVAEARDLLTVS